MFDTLNYSETEQKICRTFAAVYSAHKILKAGLVRPTGCKIWK